MEFCNTLTPHYKLEYFESSMDLCPLESFKGFAGNSISPLSESNRTVDECIQCNDRPDYECTECTCQICGHKTRAAKRYRCFSCKKVFHEWCQNISDSTSASDHWNCMNCKPKDLVLSNNELVPVKFTRQIIVRPARKINNAPRSSECTIVPANHFGPIPNIPVGTCWEYRLQASEAGVHRPLVAGIHGRENEGAYSIVLSGVYKDDFDNGDTFFYSGCGGKEKDPSKRLGAQVRNQMLTKQNRALALCCDCPLNDKEGGSAKNWRAGKPVRVIRNYKLSKFSKYAPTEGNRYDGIYKVVKYFPQKGHSGYMIWRYLLKRDDPSPAPWTAEGKRMINQLGLKVIKASPAIIEEAEEYEYTTVKIEVNDEEPLKKKFKRVRRKAGDLYPAPSPKRPPRITISSPKHETKFKEERLSPPASPELFTSYEDDIKPEPRRSSLDITDYPLISDIKPEPRRSSLDITDYPLISDIKPEPRRSSLDITDYPLISDIKSSPPHEPITPITERCVSNTTYAESPVLAAHSNGCIENVHSTSTAFTQSMSSMSYLDNAYMPHTYLNNSITSTFTNHERTYFPSNDYIGHSEPPPIIMTVSNVRSLNTSDLGFKPIKLSKPVSLKLNDPVVPEPLPIESEHNETPASVTVKSEPYELTDHIKDLISKDRLNKCWWDLCLEKYLPLGEESFIENVRQIFTCPACRKIVQKPVTLKCENRHNACLNCMTHRFEVFRARSCPACQELFGPSTKFRINETLSSILVGLFPDYNLKLSYYI